MTCDAARQLLDAYADDELDLVRAVEIERHVETCQSCAKALATHEALTATIRRGATRFTAPSELRDRIRASLAEASGGKASVSRESRGSLQIFPKLVAMAASVALIAACAWIVLHAMTRGTENDTFAANVVSDHVRSLMVDHLTDVASSDRHTVAPWFEGKIDFALTVRDFKEQGFVLTGGRLEYLADRPAAALVYRHGPHVINLFVAPRARGAVDKTVAMSRQGYNIVSWSQLGLSYWAVSGLSADELDRFARLVRAQIAPATAP